MKKRIGFTLAEVLITLGVIGVVSAITMPILIQNHQKHEMVERLKTAYSIIYQAIKMSEIDNDVVQNWELTDSIAEDEDIKAYAEKYIKPYLKNVKECNGSFDRCFSDNYYYLNRQNIGSTRTGYNLILNNGIAVRIHPSKEFNITSFTVDLNGKQKPNTYGKDVFIFVLKHGEYDNWGLGIDQKIGTLTFQGQGNTATTLKNAGNIGCNKNASNAGVLCGAWIMQNNWQIPDDYPW